MCRLCFYLFIYFNINSLSLNTVVPRRGSLKRRASGSMEIDLTLLLSRLVFVLLWSVSDSVFLAPPVECFSISAEEAFLSAVINYTNSATVHFKLSPAYILYAASRFVLRCHDSRGSPPPGSVHPVTSITKKMVAMTRNVIQARQLPSFLPKTGCSYWSGHQKWHLNNIQHTTAQYRYGHHGNHTPESVTPWLPC